MDKFTKRQKMIFSLILVGIIISSILLKKQYFDSKSSGMLEIEDLSLEDLGENEENFEEDEEIYKNESENQMIMVYIRGNVVKPGLVEIENGGRLKDVVDLSGGLMEDTDLDRINLARKVRDEEKIYIPKVGEELEELENNLVENSEGSKIDINNCCREDLLSLPGIGEKKADQIIQYRQASKFNSIEDIKNVSGIGEKTFEGFREMIYVK